MTPRVSIVVPAYNEGHQIVTTVQRLLDSITEDCEVLVVYDTPDDSTAPFAEKLAADDQRVRPTVNTYGRGPAHAIRFGLDHSQAPVAVVTMADGSDDPTQVDALVALVERGAVVAAASRYMPGGQQVGGPPLKSLVSRTVGRSLHLLARVGTRDATNSFKAYSMAFVREVGVDSRLGFEIGIEMVAKARRRRLPVAEIPTIWMDRSEGESNFNLRKFAPGYIAWYRFAFGRRLAADQMAAHVPRLEG